MAPKILLDNWMKLPSLQGIQQRRGGMHSTGWDQVGKLRFLHFCIFCFFASLPSFNWLPKIKGELCTYSEVYLWRTLSCICFYIKAAAGFPTMLNSPSTLKVQFYLLEQFDKIWIKRELFVGWIKPPISFCFSLFPLLFLIECLMTTIICLITTIPRFVLMHLPNKITYKVTATWIKNYSWIWLVGKNLCYLDTLQRKTFQDKLIPGNWRDDHHGGQKSGRENKLLRVQGKTIQRLLFTTQKHRQSPIYQKIIQ